MSAVIVRFSELGDKSEAKKELAQIFFATSTKKDFKNEDEKEAFFEKYLGFYLKNYPELTWVAKDSKILGYVCVSPVSDSEELQKLQPHLGIFKEQVVNFPAHLHINCLPDSQGMGLGTRLINEVEKHLKVLNISGLHIMTGPDSPNRHFYKRLGFDYEICLNFMGSSILFMGKRISANILDRFSHGFIT